MPSFSSVRLTGRSDCPTSRIISAFSDAEYHVARDNMRLTELGLSLAASVTIYGRSERMAGCLI
jgi:hypothetical protein